jgi:hypothetical protein
VKAIKRSFNIEGTVKSLVDAHNQLGDLINKQVIPLHNELATGTSSSIDQIAGQLQEMARAIDQLHGRIGRLENDAKLHSFHMNKIQIENTALRKCLAVAGIDIEKFKDVVDQLLTEEFLVNSDYVPAGNVKITEYN